MRLGTRWTSGEEPPQAVPEALREGIAGVDATIPVDMLGAPRPRWTLTWLEGKPIAELATGVQVELDDDGNAVVRHAPDDDFA
ncbi:hypothetical protein [Microbacterium aquimaris]|uniref:Fe-S oxidoreductase n=1 Tax=Microbacterium aquimaris TaxID=459816 RepID=A0ABU5N8B5_9MICO|nr:hypothetical protein [Microbacterium aquimaris]MAP64238.1 hypothetical protein [Microbacterium sp.]MDZ8162222.1 hypothetical protein [Microbacterium aquimaris]MDZ8275890.1 hypothetical protein [Microbacterium aquimaris]|tara:strand:+ start:1094 stop:1342 length:249 start_codon:yes stop_codon:yes gene_type:complete